MLTTYERHSRRKLAATVVSILVIAGFVVFADHIKSKTALASVTPSPTTSLQTPSTSTTVAAPSPTTTSSTTNTPAVSTPAMTNSSGFKDGSFTASSSYYVPHSNESIQVSVSLKNGIITAASIQNSEGDNQSAYYQESFAAAYKSYVVGKKINSLQLGVIAGASDTSIGFQAAISQISSKAQA